MGLRLDVIAFGLLTFLKKIFIYSYADIIMMVSTRRGCKMVLKGLALGFFSYVFLLLVINLQVVQPCGAQRHLIQPRASFSLFFFLFFYYESYL